MKKTMYLLKTVIVLIVISAVSCFLVSCAGGSGSDKSTNDTEVVEETAVSPQEPDQSSADSIAEQEEIDKIIASYWKYFKVSIQYDTKMMGGLKNTIVTLNNDTPFEVKSMTVAVEYLSKKDKSLNKVYVSFKDIAGGSKESMIIEDSKKGKKAKAYIVKIDVPEIGLVK